MSRNRILIELPNGNLLVRAAFNAEGVTGDGLVEVERGSAEYEEWTRWIQANQQHNKIFLRDGIPTLATGGAVQPVTMELVKRLTEEE